MAFSPDDLKALLTDWWPAILACLLGASKLANAVTKHWPQWKPWLRWLGFLIEVTDLIRVPELKKKGCSCEAGKDCNHK